MILSFENIKARSYDQIGEIQSLLLNFTLISELIFLQDLFSVIYCDLTASHLLPVGGTGSIFEANFLN